MLGSRGSIAWWRTVVCSTLCTHMNNSNVNDKLFFLPSLDILCCGVFGCCYFFFSFSLHIYIKAYIDVRIHVNYIQIIKHAFYSSYAFSPITYLLAVCETKPLLAIRSTSLMIFNSNNFIVFVRIVRIRIVSTLYTYDIPYTIRAFTTDSF